MKGRIIQDNLYLVHLTVEHVDTEAELINLDQSKAFDRVDYRFLDVVVLVGLGPYFHSWIRLLCISGSE